MKNLRNATLSELVEFKIGVRKELKNIFGNKPFELNSEEVNTSGKMQLIIVSDNPELSRNEIAANNGDFTKVLQEASSLFKKGIMSMCNDVVIFDMLLDIDMDISEMALY